MKSVLKAAAAIASLALASCGGGGGGNAAIGTVFNYGPPQAPSAAEQDAASSAEGSVTASSSFGTAPSASNGTTIIAIADDLAASALGSAAVPAAVAQDPRLRSALRTAATIPACTTTTQTSVSFNQCTDTQSGFSFTMSGMVSVSGDKITWDVTGNFSGSDQGVSFNVNLHQSGSLTVGAQGTMTGNSLSEIGGTVSGNGQSVTFGVSTAALVDLTYTSNCITSGTIEVKRVWSPRPDGLSQAQAPDVGVKLTWTGCATIEVQHSM
jgi:hypothetical protein